MSFFFIFFFYLLLLQNSCFIRYLPHGCTGIKEVETDNVVHFFVRFVGLIDRDVFAIVKALTPSFVISKKIHNVVACLFSFPLSQCGATTEYANATTIPLLICKNDVSFYLPPTGASGARVCPNHRR